MGHDLLERDGVLALLDDVVGRAVAGSGAVVLLEASAGIGNAAVLDTVSAPIDGAAVVCARGGSV